MTRVTSPNVKQPSRAASAARRAAARDMEPSAPQPGRSGDVHLPPRRRLPKRRGMHWVLSLPVATSVGVAAFVAGGFEYRASVELSITDSNVEPNDLDGLRRDLLDLAWQRLDPSACRWRLDLIPETRVLGVTVASPRAVHARVAVAGLAESFLDHVRAVVDQAKAEPGPDEVVLASFREARQKELHALGEDVERLEASLPDGDHEAQDAAVREQVTGRLMAYTRYRDRVHEAEAELTSIRATPEPDRAPIDPEVRAHALEADLELQQDLKALRVHLAEARHQLLKVREAAVPALEGLSAAAAKLEASCAGEPAQAATPEVRQVVEQIAASAAEYRALLAQFALAWGEEFERLARLQDDPRQAEVLEIQAALHVAFSGFMFPANEIVAAVREHVRALSNRSTGAARHHELVSWVVRTFHAFQTAHQRFEFIAADVQVANNFRLEAAVKSARGLRYRSRQRLEAIDARLARQALAELRAERQRRIASLTEQINDQRPMLDRSVEELLATHELVHANEPVLRSLLRNKALAALGQERIAQLREELSQIDTRLTDLAAARIKVINPERIELSPVRVDRWPVNLSNKITLGTLATFTALLILLGLQAWLAPKPL